jgi:lysophospholipase L1-like esterase
MKWIAPILIGSFAFLTPAVADMPPACRVAESQIENSFPLPAVRKAIAAKSLTISVIGAGSSQLPGAEGVSKAYPARLQAALAEALPDVTVTVSTDVKQGRTALEAAKQLKPVIGANKPNLVIWQTGTVDALRMVEPEDFNASLSKGVGIAKAAGADTVLVNMQYSPRSESMISLGNYLEGMRWVALQQEVPLFDRFHVMKLWNELGTFDLYADTKKMDTAEKVHDCIGRLLAEMINNAAKLDGTVQVPDIK